MPYVLGIDVGTSRTRAAVSRRGPAGWVDPVVVGLGATQAGVPTVLYLAPDRSAVVGDEAELHAPIEPGRIARDFSRRIGDDVPLVLGGTPCTPQELTAVLIRWVTDLVAGHEGAPADHLVVTHPSGWGAHRKSLLHHELVRQGLTELTLLAEPLAAAEGYTRPGAERLEDGDALAVLALGAGVPESAVVRRGEGGRFEVLAHAEGAEDLGGLHYDDVLVGFVRAELGAAFDELDPADPQSLAAMARLRALCVEVKEMLSTEAEVTMPVRLPGAQADLRVTRADLERLIRPAVDAAVDLVPRVVAAAGLEPRRLAAVALVGGSARIPLVAEAVRAAAPARVAVDAEADAAVAIGAAVAARRVLTGPDPEPLSAAEETTVIPRIADPLELAGSPVRAGLAVIDEDDAPPPRPPVRLTPLDLPDRRLLHRLLPGVRPAVLTTVGIAVAAVGIVLTFMFQSNTGGQQPSGPFRGPVANQTATQPASPNQPSSANH